MSPLHAILARLAVLPPRAAHLALDCLLSEYTVVELAAAHYDWQLHARPEQLLPQGPWRSVLMCMGRGAGKTRSSVSFMLAEVAAGRAKRIACVAQSEQKAIEIFVTGETGILALAAPWLDCRYESSANRLVFGNGAVATLYTSAEPSGLRGPQHDLALASEIAAWPVSTAAETMSNLQLGLRLGYGKLVMDTTPRKRSAILRERFALAAKDPEKHIVRRGRSEDNAINLTAGFCEELREQFSGRLANEELDGEYFDDAESAIFKQAWIDAARRKMPEKIARRVISIDPAITDSKRSDATGIVEVCAGVNGQLYVTANLSDRHRAEVWPELVVARYVSTGADLITAETNRGGNFIKLAIANACHARGLSLIELGPTEAPAGRAGVVYFKPYNSKGSKVSRAEVAAALVQRGRVSFVGDLGDLEERLCDFDGSEGKIDDSVDAFVAGVVELSGLASNAPPKMDVDGLMAAADALGISNPTTRHLQKTAERALLGGSGWRGATTNIGGVGLGGGWGGNRRL